MAYFIAEHYWGRVEVVTTRNLTLYMPNETSNESGGQLSRADIRVSWDMQAAYQGSDANNNATLGTTTRIATALFGPYRAMPITALAIP
jgi:hypothetical protein